MKRILFFSIVPILLLLMSCNRENDFNKWGDPCYSNTDTVYMSSADMQYCRYKTGTYWIFIDSVTNRYDSVAVVSFNQGFGGPLCDKSLFETHTFKTHSSYSSKSIDYLVYNWGIFKNLNKFADIGVSVTSISLIYIDFDRAVSSSNCLIERLDSAYIYDQYYKKVLRVEIKEDCTENNNKSVYFMNSEFGFLRHNIYEKNVLISQKVLMRKRIVR